MHSNLHSIDSKGRAPAVWDHVELAMSHNTVDEDIIPRSHVSDDGDMMDLQAVTAAVLVGAIGLTKMQTLFG